MDSLKSYISQPVLAAVCLVAAWSQIGLGARFSETGEQLGAALPLSTLVLGAVVVAALMRSWPPRLPWLSLWQILFLCAMGIGLLGFSRSEVRAAIPQWIQVAEVAVISAWLFHGLLSLPRRSVISLLAGLCAILLGLGLTGLVRLPFLALSEAKYGAFVVMAFPFLMVRIRNWRFPRAVLVAAVAGLIVGMTFRDGGLLLGWLLVVLLLGIQLRGDALRLGLIAAGAAILVSLAPDTEGRTAWSTLQPRYDREHLKRPYLEMAAALRAPRFYPVGVGLGRYKAAINVLRQYGTAVPHPADQKVPRDGNNQYLVTLVEAGLPAALALCFLILATSLQALPAGSGARSPEDAERVAVACALFGCWLAGFFCVTFSRGTGIWLGGLLGLAARERIPRYRSVDAIVRLAVPGAALLVALLVMIGFNAAHPGREQLSAANRWIRRAAFGEGGLRSGLQVVSLPDEPGMEAQPVLVQVEAEDCLAHAPPFAVIRVDDASGLAALAVPDLAGKGKGSATFELNVPEDGTYKLYARVHWEDGCSNSLQFQVAGQDIVIASDLFRHWHKLYAKRTLELKRGTIRVVVQNLEDGVRLDYFGLRRDASATP